jgi:predicted nucleic acid-binding protein
VIAYAESSAVLAWLLGEPKQTAVREALARAERVASSSLTTLECARGLVRAVTMGRVSRTQELAAVQVLHGATASWMILEMAGGVLDRARARFPHEPLRTLDALHLATAVLLLEAHGSLTMVSLDDRIRANSSALGFAIAP